MRVKEILLCQQTVMYGNSRMRKLLPQPARFVELPDPFLQWLGQDGVVVMKSRTKPTANDVDFSDGELSSAPSQTCSRRNSWGSSTSSSADEDTVASSPTDSDTHTDADSGSEFLDAHKLVRKQIAAAIAALDGQAFVKLNWSSPKDAKWMLGGRLTCNSARCA